MTVCSLCVVTSFKLLRVVGGSHKNQLVFVKENQLEAHIKGRICISRCRGSLVKDNQLIDPCV
jgi:hypothetical protein